MIADRTQIPATKRIAQINAALPERLVLDNGIPVFVLRSQISEACRIDIVFRAGSYHQQAPLIARFTNALMMEGTLTHGSFETASLLEFYGAYLHAFAQKDFAGFSLSVLASRLPEVLPLIQGMIREPALLDQELNLLRDREKKAFIDDMRKVQTIAAREFNKLIFGKNHPYGIKAELEDFDRLNTFQIRDFHQQKYLQGECFILACGGLPKDFEERLNQFFGAPEQAPRDADRSSDELSLPLPEKGFLEMPDKLQNAIRVGRATINIAHPDYPDLKVLNTILGGYFGSRLMTNIREEKGYTYGIYSMIISYHCGGLFLISTESGADTWKPALDEIYKELDRLCNEAVGEDELELVRSYMVGALQRALDCPFNTMDYLRTLFEAGMDPGNYLKTYLNSILNIDPKQLAKIAHAYLTPATLSEFVCGRK